MPRARVTIAASVNPKLERSRRKARMRSCLSRSISIEYVYWPGLFRSRFLQLEFQRMGRPPSALPNRRERAVAKSPVGRAGAPAVLAPSLAGHRALSTRRPIPPPAAVEGAGNEQGDHCISTDRAIPRLVHPDPFQVSPHIVPGSLGRVTSETCFAFGQVLRRQWRFVKFAPAQRHPTIS